MTDTIPAGKLINTHGLKGALKAEIFLDAAVNLKKIKRVLIDNREMGFSCVDATKAIAVVKIDGIDDINAAMTLKGKEFSIYRQDAKLPKGKFFLQDVFGAKAVDQNGNEIGIVKDVIENPAHPILVIEGDAEHLIPAVSEFIKDADLENGIIHISLIEGM